MKNNTDQSSGHVFSYEIKKDKKVFIYWYDLQVKILNGENANKFLKKAKDVDGIELQQLISKFTSNLKTKRDGDIDTIVINGVFHSRKINQCFFRF
ncbi:MAG: hypothetical protein K0R71_1506 [Bacillales bacterium]|nr:hypothetical protein [Bacillales bacterium]